MIACILAHSGWTPLGSRMAELQLPADVISLSARPQLWVPRGPKVAAEGNLMWVAVEELNLSYRNPKTKLFSIYPYDGN